MAGVELVIAGECGVEMLIKSVGDVGVGEGQSVGLLSQGGGGVGVAEAGLGSQDLSSGDEERGHVVAGLVKCGVDSRGVAQALEAVTRCPDGETLLVLEGRG